MLLTALGISFYLGWILTLVVLGTLPIIAFCWFRNISVRLALKKEREEMFIESDTKCQGSYSSIKLVKQMNA